MITASGTASTNMIDMVNVRVMPQVPIILVALVIPNTPVACKVPTPDKYTVCQMAQLSCHRAYAETTIG